MPVRQFPGLWRRRGWLLRYGLALALAGLAVTGRGLTQLAGPGVAAYVTVLPAIVVAGVFCGTGPGVLTAAAGGSAIAAWFLGDGLLVWPPFTSAQLDTALFVAACVAILWSTAASRRAAQAAARAEAQLAEMFRQIPGAAAILKAPEGYCMLSSAHAVDILGHPPREMRTDQDMTRFGGVHKDGRAFAAAEYPIVRALRNGEIVAGEKLLYRRPDGRVVTLEVYAGPVRDRDGAIIAAIGTAFDVSDRVAAEQRLQDSETQHRAAAERLRAALAAGALGLWEIDLARERISLDAAFAGMLGLHAAPAEMAFAEFERFIDADALAGARAVFYGAVARQGDYLDELQVRAKCGAQRWLVSRGAVLPGTGKVVGVVSDITERRQREDALQQALSAREVLMHEADHRIKNSLQLVISLLSLQLARVSDPDAADALRSAMARVHAVADAHLALQQSTDLSSIEIDPMLEQLVARVALLNPALCVRCASASGLALEAERAIPLGLIASELLTNALRHAYAPGDAGEVVLRAIAAEDALVMTISDRGIGLPAAAGRGGLGSAVISALARQIGARLERQSQPGEGTTVTLHLPVPPPAAPASPLTTPLPAAAD